MSSRDRLERVLALFDAGRDRALWLEPGSNLRWLTGLRPPALERPAGLLVRGDGRLCALVPLLDRSEWEFAGIEHVTWADGEAPVEALRGLLEGVSTIHIQGTLQVRSVKLLRAARPSMRIAVGPDPIAVARRRKDAGELERLRRAAAAADEAIASIAAGPLEGRSELELRNDLQAEYLRLGVEPSPHTLVAAGANSSHPHHAGAEALIGKAEPVIVDTGAVVDGYLSDTTRLLAQPDTSAVVLDAYEVMVAAHDAALAAAVPGSTGSDVDLAARTVVESAGFGEAMLHRVGHGLGLEVHEQPYLAPGSEDPIEEDAVICVEPAIYLRGRFGVRFENVVHVGRDGAQALNRLGPLPATNAKRASAADGS